MFVFFILFLIFAGVLLYHDTWTYYDRKCENNRIERLQCMKSFCNKYFPNGTAYICYLPFLSTYELVTGENGGEALKEQIAQLRYLHYINENVLDLDLFFKPISIDELVYDFFCIEGNTCFSDFLKNQQNIFFEQNTYLDRYYDYGKTILITNKATFDLSKDDIIFKGRGLGIGADFRLQKDKDIFHNSLQNTISGIHVPPNGMTFEMLPFAKNSQDILSNYCLDESYLYNQKVMLPY